MVQGRCGTGALTLLAHAEEDHRIAIERNPGPTLWLNVSEDRNGSGPIATESKMKPSPIQPRRLGGVVLVTGALLAFAVGPTFAHTNVSSAATARHALFTAELVGAEPAEIGEIDQLDEGDQGNVDQADQGNIDQVDQGQSGDQAAAGDQGQSGDQAAAGDQGKVGQADQTDQKDQNETADPAAQSGDQGNQQDSSGDSGSKGGSGDSGN